MKRIVLLFALACASSRAETFFEIRSILQADAIVTRFGAALAVDGETLVVTDSLWRRESPGGFYGAAMVYQRNGSDWELETTLSPPGFGYGSELGVSVAIDGNTIAVGSTDASYEVSPGVSGAGQVLVFQRTGGEWSPLVAVHPPTQKYGNFGISVALYGDTMAVGAPGQNNGEVAIYNRSGNAWAETVVLGDSISRSGFGSIVHFMDASTLIVAIPNRDFSPLGTGEVIVYSLIDGVWKQTASLVSNSDSSFQFGSSLAGEGNLLVVGCPGGAGCAFVFERAGTQWNQIDRLTASNGEPRDNFGTSVAINGGKIAVGAPQEQSIGFLNNRNQSDNTINRAGAVYYFERVGATWEEVAFLKSPNGTLLGTALAFDGDRVIAGGTNRALTFEPAPARDIIELELTAYSPDLNEPYAGPGVFGFDEPWPVAIFGSLLTTSPTSLRFEFNGTGDFDEGDCTCIILSDPYGKLGDIKSVTINPETNLPGFDASRFSFDANTNTITLNAGSLEFEAGHVVHFDLVIAGQTSPVKPFAINAYTKGGSLHQFDFTDSPARTGFRLRGTSDLQNYVDHTAASTLTEQSPGRYRLRADLPLLTSDAYFFQIEQIGR